MSTQNTKFDYNIPEYWKIFHTLEHDFDSTTDTCAALNVKTCEQCPFFQSNPVICTIELSVSDYNNFVKNELPKFRITHPEYFI